MPHPSIPCSSSAVVPFKLTLETQITRDSVLVKPINTPITPLCSKSVPVPLQLSSVSSGISLRTTQCFTARPDTDPSTSESHHSYLGACSPSWNFSRRHQHL